VGISPQMVNTKTDIVIRKLPHQFSLKIILFYGAAATVQFVFPFVS
jgi:hypothetical protein